MPLPGNVTTITVTGTYTSPTGTPLTGTIRFTPNTQTLVDAAVPRFITGTVSAPLDATGRFSVDLPCTDDPDLSPTGRAFSVAEELNGLPEREPYLVELPHTLGASVDLAAVVPVAPAPPQYSTVYGVLAQPNDWAGLNAFAVPPTGPDPMTSHQLATKQYVDATAGGAPVTSVNNITGAVVLTAALVGAVALSTVTTKGDLFIATGAGTVARLPAGADGEVLQADSDQAAGVRWVAAAASTKPTVRQAYFATAAIIFDNDAVFTGYPAAQLAIPAAVGDWVELSIGGMWQHTGSDFLELAVAGAGGALVRFSSTGTGTPGFEGDPMLYPDTGLPKFPGVFGFHAEAGDIVGGSVTFILAHRGGGGSTLYSDTNYPLRMRALNLHDVG